VASTMNKRERNFIHPAIYSGWEIEHCLGDSKGYWDGDKYMPVSVGAICKSLVDKGYLEAYKVHVGHTTTYYRATAKAKSLKCYNEMCSRGYIVNDDDYVTDVRCPHCEDGIKYEVNRCQI